MRGAACCLAYGTRVRDRLAGLGADPGKILITGNASPYRHTPAAPDEMENARREWRIGSMPVVLFLGRLLAFKAPEILVDAFAIVRREIPSFLLMAGDGPRREPLLRQAQRLGLTDIADHRDRKCAETGKRICSTRWPAYSSCLREGRGSRNRGGWY